MPRLPTTVVLWALAFSLALPAAASPESLRDAAEEEVSALLAEHPTARAHWRNDLVGPSMLLGLFLEAEGATPRAKAEAFLAEHAGLFALEKKDLAYASETVTNGRTVVTFHQVHGDKRVYQRSLTVTVDGRGLVTRVINDTFPIEKVRKSTRTKTFARDLAVTRTAAESAADVERVELVVVAGPAGAYDAALVRVAPRKDRLEVLEVVVDQSRGEVTSLRPAVMR